MQIREVRYKPWEKDARNNMAPVISYFSHELKENNHRFRFNFNHAQTINTIQKLAEEFVVSNNSLIATIMDAHSICNGAYEQVNPDMPYDENFNMAKILKHWVNQTHEYMTTGT